MNKIICTYKGKPTAKQTTGKTTSLTNDVPIIFTVWMRKLTWIGQSDKAIF